MKRHAAAALVAFALLTSFVSVVVAQTAAPPPPPEGPLVAGQRVEIKGRLENDGSIRATRIRLQAKDTGVKIEGPVAAVDLPQRQLVIAGFVVRLSDDVRIERLDGPAEVTDIQRGDIVEAKGRWSADQLRASRLRLRSTQGPTTISSTQEAEIEADIEQAERGGAIVVLGRRVHLAAGGKIADERTRATAEGALTETQGRLRRDEDDLHVAPLRIGNRVTLGGRVGGDMRSQRHMSRRTDEWEHQEMASTAGQVIASAMLPRGIELYSKLFAERFFSIADDGGPLTGQPSVRVYEAYAMIGVESPVAVQVGRQRFRDAREWFFDDYLDAVRLHVRRASWRAEAAIAEGVFAGPLDQRSRRDQMQIVTSFTQRFGERTEGTAFLIARNDRSRRERPRWIGGEWNGRATRAVKYWSIAALRRGESDTQKLGGWAFDSGVAWRMPLPLAPSVAFSYAAASGDETGSDGVDTRFRQTGLEDNSARLHGLKRFAQYGEVLDPELSNIEVLTVGGGVRPFSRTSVDVVYHRFKQRLRRRSLPSNRLEATGTGDSTDMGDEFDVILAIQQIRRMDFSIVAGVFRPGAGVASPSRKVVYWKPEVRFFF